jgi:hypothetical protein
MTWLARLIVLSCVVLVSGCYAQQEWLGRQLSGIDCRYEHLDAQGRCVPYQR